MPRVARLDAPGVVHHVIFRGIERKKIFRNTAPIFHRVSKCFYAFAYQLNSHQLFWFRVRLLPVCRI